VSSAEEYLPREKKGSPAIALLSSGRNAAVMREECANENRPNFTAHSGIGVYILK
jgi:hypothetical protein